MFLLSYFKFILRQWRSLTAHHNAHCTAMTTNALDLYCFFDFSGYCRQLRHIPFHIYILKLRIRQVFYSKRYDLLLRYLQEEDHATHILYLFI